MDQPKQELQQQLSAFWSQRPGAKSPGTMVVRSAQEHQVWAEALLPLLPPPPADVLDVGTGQGFLALLLADLGHHVTGIDTAEGMLNAAREHAASSDNRPDFRLGNAMEPPVSAASVDVVCNRQVVWTLLDPTFAFSNWLALLRPGGRLLSIHLRQNQFTSSGSYPQEVSAVLPPLRLDSSSEAVVTRYDREYPDAVANLARETGFTDVTLASLEAVDRFEEEIGTERRWLVVTGRKPS
jgi:ubiquinone/menaquinone biosynthesis C-methylase UbiE